MWDDMLRDVDLRVLQDHVTEFVVVQPNAAWSGKSGKFRVLHRCQRNDLSSGCGQAEKYRRGKLFIFKWLLKTFFV